MRKLVVRFIAACLLSAGAASVSRAGQYFQDFSSANVGATNFGDGSVLYAGGQSSNTVGVTDATYKELRLTELNGGSARTAFLLPDLDNTSKVFAFSAKFNAVIFGTFATGAADGVSFTFGPVRSLNLTNSFYLQEDGFGTGITFSIRTYSNNAPGFYVRVNGSNVASSLHNPLTQWGNLGTTRHLFEVDWNSGSGMTAKMDGTNIFTDVATTNFRPHIGDAFVFAARCGGLVEEIRLDNILVMSGGNLVQVPMTSPYYKSSENVGPGETADKAFDDANSTKWLGLNATGHVGATCVSNARAVRAYTLTSANDGQQRDPKGWTMDGSNDSGTNWTQCHSGGGSFINRFEQRAWIATNLNSFSAFRLNITTNHLDPLVQLAEFKLYEFVSYGTFSLNTTSITTTAQGDVAWVDYNNDGLLDLASGGSLGFGGSINELWRNLGNGSFSNSVSLGGLRGSFLSTWADYDNDGFADYVYAGSYNEGYAALFHNNGDGTFTLVFDPAMVAEYRGEMVSADFDNDGYIDIYYNGLTHGSLVRTPVLLHNNGNGTFTRDTRSSIQGLYDCEVTAGDYNKDGYVDILQSGRNADGFTITSVTEIYTNRGDGALFLDSGLSLTGAPLGSCAFVDYDNDADLDFHNTGVGGTISVSILQVYHGNGAGGFTQNTSNGLYGVRFGDISWGDYDADGRVDPAICGEYAYDIYYNRGNATFSQDPGDPPYTQYAGRNAWGDYDNDGALDLLSNGGTNGLGGQTGTILVHNELGISNAPPAAPAAMGITNQSGLRVTLTWSAPADDTTPAAGLSYDVRLGTTSGGFDIVRPLANFTNGKRRVSAPGRVRGQTRMILNLPLGTYYWSVQAVDQGLAGGAYSTQMQFTVSSGGGAPTAMTAAASGVDATTERANGTVYANGLATTIWFEYGLTTNYGSATASGTQNFANVSSYSTNITGLSPATLYNYRVVASNSAGVSFGSNLTFTTLGGTPTASTQPAIDVNGTNATLVGQANPNYMTTVVWFVWGATTNYGNTTAGQDVGNGGAAVTATSRIVGLTSSSTYHYRFFASNVFGVATGANVSVTTANTNALIDATAPGNTIVGSSTNSPGSEQVSMAIDNIVSTKYLNFDKTNTGFDVAVYDASRIVQGLTFFRANGAPERDPTNFVLSGSSDGSNFTPIASGAVPAFSADYEMKSVTITNASAYPVYRVRFPNLADEGSANSMQISEVELTTLTEISSSNDTISAQVFGSLWSQPQRLLDGKLDANEDKFAVENNVAEVFVFISPAIGATVLKGFEIIGGNDSALYPERHPTNINIRGSNDGTNYFVIGTFKPAVPGANRFIDEFIVSNNAAVFAQYRFEFAEQTSGIWWQLGEFRLFGESASPFDLWRYQRYGTTNVDASADTDGDGNSTLIEYATGSGPTFSNSAAPFTAVRSNNVHVLFNWNTNASDATIYVEGANALSNGAPWTGIATNRNGSWGGATNVIEGGGNPAPVNVTDTQPGTNRFLRLRVTHP